MLQELGGGNLVGPYLVGFKESIQIAPLGANVSDIVNLAALAAFKNWSSQFGLNFIPNNFCDIDLTYFFDFLNTGWRCNIDFG